MSLTDIDQTDLLAKVENNAEIVNWSEERQNEFVQTFKQRSQVTRFILLQTAEEIWETAHRRHFISDKHYRAIIKDLIPLRDTYRGRDNGRHFEELKGAVYDNGGGPRHNYTVGGREYQSLMLIAQQRAKQVIASLPPLARAVSIIDAVTSKKIERKDKLLKDGEGLREKLDEVCGVISLSDQDPKMTIGEFLTNVRTRESERQNLIRRMNDIADEGRRLEEEISKALFAGLPGLSDAVVDVIRNHVEQAIAFEATCRRVEEQVKFGNSTAAVDLLRHFEKDELKVSDEVKARFDAALEALKVGSKSKKSKTSKALRA